MGWGKGVGWALGSPGGALWGPGGSLGGGWGGGGGGLALVYGPYCPIVGLDPHLSMAVGHFLVYVYVSLEKLV